MEDPAFFLPDPTSIEDLIEELKNISDQGIIAIDRLNREIEAALGDIFTCKIEETIEKAKLAAKSHAQKRANDAKFRLEKLRPTLQKSVCSPYIPEIGDQIAEEYAEYIVKDHERMEQVDEIYIETLSSYYRRCKETYITKRFFDNEYETNYVKKICEYAIRHFQTTSAEFKKIHDFITRYTTTYRRDVKHYGETLIAELRPWSLETDMMAILS
jgi:hypothetical protein